MRGDLARTRSSAALSRVGTPIVLRHLTTSGGATPAQNPPTIKVLVAAGDQPQGSTTLALRAGLLLGEVVAGDQFVIGGNKTLYTATATVIAVDNAVTLPITPPLGAEITDGTPVATVWSADETVYAVINSFPAIMIDGTLIQQSDLRVTIAALTLRQPPLLTDKLLIGAVARSILNVTPFYSAGQVTHYQLQAR